jgi:hypothetical protein
VLDHPFLSENKNYLPLPIKEIILYNKIKKKYFEVNYFQLNLSFFNQLPSLLMQ